MPADLNLVKRSKVRSWKNSTANQKSDKSEIVLTKRSGRIARSIIEKLKYPDTCAKFIERLNALLRASARELHTVRIENSELRQLLTTLKKANALLQEQISKDGFTSPSANHDYVTLQNENQRLSSELEISRGKLNAMATAWEDCYKRLLAENKQLRNTVADLQETIKVLQHREKPDCPKCENEVSLEATSTPYSGGLDCGCHHVQQVRCLKEKLKELRIREANQHNRANDLEISLDAYKIALEKQFSENQTFIKKLSEALGTSLPTGSEISDKPKAICDLSACNDLTQWIEKALKSALEENGERIRKLNGGSRMSLDLESTPPPSPPSTSLPLLTRRYSYANSHQYTKHPVNGRSKSRKISLRLQTLTKTMETLNNPCPNKTRTVSPLETLLLMVNEILEKLTEGRMEEYIHNERRKLLQGKNGHQIQIAMTTTTA
nr:hypothetical transcript [Hymenolepis microstoma]